MTREPGRSNLFSLPLRALQELPLWGSADGELNRRDAKELIERLDSVRIYAGGVEERFVAHIREADQRFHESARNLLHYLALRHFDLRNLQERLAALGLSSLGRTEAHTLASLYAVRRALERAAGLRITSDLQPKSGVGFQQGTEFLTANTVALLGPAPKGREVRIMVTLPSEAAEDYELVRDLVKSGMDCARINCAHDGEQSWAQMVKHIERATGEVGRACKILMDLGGPKLRTGMLEPGPQVVRARPKRDVRGRTLTPARLWFAPPGVAAPEGTEPDAVVPVTSEWIAAAQTGDKVELQDARDAHRTVRIVLCALGGCWGELWKTAYLETGIELRLLRAEETVAVARIGEIPPVEIPIVLTQGDVLVLRRDPKPGAPTLRAPDGSVLSPAHISCTMPEAFNDVRPGEVIRLDDGKVEGIVRSVTGDEMRVEVTLAKPGGTKLRGDKGINFPDSRLHAAALTAKDLADLDFVVGHADLIGMSFVNDPDDVVRLQEELRQRKGDHLGVVLKIETQRGFRQLPWLLLAAMRTYPVGVMIARGDLAVECGWERLAEVQEEILWLCEAAHVPVIWATQVLESLAKKGLPSRAEITDAAMAERAECVMLNKGPYIIRAVSTLDHILRRMQEHQSKKTARLRNLTLAGDV